MFALHFVVALVCPWEEVSVMAKNANPRNHQGANTDVITRGFIYKLEIGSVYSIQQSRDLDPETKKHSSVIGASGQ